MAVDPNIDTVARTIFGEVRNHPLLDKMAVGAVIRERFLRPGWWSREKGDNIPDDTWQAVCRDPWQFTCWNAHDAAHKLNRDRMLSAEKHDPQAFDVCYAVALYVVKYMTDADVRQLFHASSVDDFPTHYHHRNFPKPASWGDCRAVPTMFDSVHIFYTGVQGTPKRRELA